MIRFLSTFSLVLILAVSSFGGVVANESSLLMPDVRTRDFGSGLRWKDASIRIGVSDSILSSSNIKFGSDISGAIRRSIAAWEAVADIDIETVESDRNSVSPSGNAGDGVSLLTIAGTNENVLFFTGHVESLSAKTRVFYNRRGQITEADIVLNPFVQFSTDGTYGTFDLELTLRHEIGHLLGLGHSPVVAATMYDGISRNGVLGARGAIRALSADDIAAVRSIYGVNGDDENCCSAISGRLSFSGRTHRDVTIWALEKTTGRVVGYSKLSRARTYKLGGLDFGEYEILAIETFQGKASAAQRIGDAVVSADSAAVVNARFLRKLTDLSINYLGSDGLLADSPIGVERGTQRRIMIGGKGLNGNDLRIRVDSTHISVDEGSITEIDYAEGISALSFAVNVDDNAPAGNYSVYAMSAAGERQYLIGGISVPTKAIKD